MLVAVEHEKWPPGLRVPGADRAIAAAGGHKLATRVERNRCDLAGVSTEQGRDVESVRNSPEARRPNAAAGCQQLPSGLSR